MKFLLTIFVMWVALAVGWTAASCGQPQMDILAAASFAVTVSLGLLVMYAYRGK